MSSDPKTSAVSGRSAAKTPGAAGRQERLAQALRDNLKKRKAQQRQRRDAPPEPESGGPADGGQD